MKCPKCDSPKIGVADSRNAFGTIRRKRECKDCKHKWLTFEVTVDKYRELMERVFPALEKLRDEINVLTGSL